MCLTYRLGLEGVSMKDVWDTSIKSCIYGGYRWWSTQWVLESSRELLIRSAIVCLLYGRGIWMWYRKKKEKLVKCLTWNNTMCVASDCCSAAFKSLVWHWHKVNIPQKKNNIWRRMEKVNKEKTVFLCSKKIYIFAC